MPSGSVLPPHAPQINSKRRFSGSPPLFVQVAPKHVQIGEYGPRFGIALCQFGGSGACGTRRGIAVQLVQFPADLACARGINAGNAHAAGAIVEAAL